MNDSPALRLLVITVSDSASAGEREDRSGPRALDLARQFLESAGWTVAADLRVLPDEEPLLSEVMARAVAEGIDLVLTTGGTGLGPRDRTPEATRSVVEREVVGLMEAVRARYRQELPAAMLSRAVAGVAARTLICNLPGSVRAVQESLAVILPALPHALRMIGGEGHGD
jgi:molybdopterin adenylyltransferase